MTQSPITSNKTSSTLNKSSATASTKLDESARRTSTEIMQPSQKSPFLSLPAELRNRIYEDVAQDAVLTGFHGPGVLREKNGTDLLKTCKQIQSESLPIVLAGAQLYLRVSRWDFSPVIDVFNNSEARLLTALRTNKRVTILMNTNARLSRSPENRIQQWLTFRQKNGNIDFEYALDCLDSACTMECLIERIKVVAVLREMAYRDFRAANAPEILKMAASVDAGLHKKKVRAEKPAIAGFVHEELVDSSPPVMIQTPLI